MGGVTRLWLIAGREFNAYVATASFWIALLIGPLAMAGTVTLGSFAFQPAAPAPISVLADDAGLTAATAAALSRAANIDHAPTPRLTSGAAAARILVHRQPDGTLSIRFEGPVALSPAARALVVASIERDDAENQLGRTPRDEPAAAPETSPHVDLNQIGRFPLVMILWLTLTGSLGMLLQAVVRERTNRALETLLAAARPWEIVFGKLAGVGGVSILVLLAWLGSVGAMAALAPGAGGKLAPLLQIVGQPGLLAYALMVYLLAYLMFGLVTVAVGAAAADTAAAQNLSRPMFAVLLAVFFAALAAVGGAGDRLGWLIYAPPFAPFMLLLKPQPLGAQFAGFALLCLSITVLGHIAVNGVSLKSGSRPLKWPNLMQANSNSL